MSPSSQSSSQPQNNVALTEEQQHPIREVSRLTGVNSVTLRAWERRYGLVKPVRTPKGHRLYTESEIKKIQDIVQWLNRGVAIGKVRELLGKSSTQPEEVADGLPGVEAATDLEAWGNLCQRFIAALTQLNDQRADDVYNQALAVYPLDVVSQQLVLPSLARLRERWLGQFGSGVERSFVESYFRARILTRLYHGNRAASQTTLLVTGMYPEESEIEALLVAQSCSSSGFRVKYLQPTCPWEEWVLATQNMQVQGLILVGGQRTDCGRLVKLLNGLQGESAFATLVTGYLVDIHANELEQAGQRCLSLSQALHQNTLSDALAAMLNASALLEA